MISRIKLDTSSLRRDGAAYVSKSVRPAAVDALNQAAEAGRLAVIEAMPAYLDRPTPYTLMGVGMTPASPDTPRASDLVATVRIKPKQAQWLQYQILGGTRGAGDYGTTDEGPLVPGPDAELDAYGNLPTGFVESEEAQGATWVTLKAGEPPALVRTVGGRTEILALIVHELHYDAGHLPFYDIVEKAVKKSFASQKLRR